MFSPVVLRSNAGHGLLMLEASRSHTMPHHSRQDSFEQVISQWQRQHRTLTRDRHTWTRRESNPQSVCFYLQYILHDVWFVIPNLVLLFSFSVLLSHHTREPYESVLFINTVCQCTVGALLCFPNFKDTANRAFVCCMLSSVFCQYFHLFEFILLQLL